MPRALSTGRPPPLRPVRTARGTAGTVLKTWTNLNISRPGHVRQVQGDPPAPPPSWERGKGDQRLRQGPLVHSSICDIRSPAKYFKIVSKILKFPGRAARAKYRGEGGMGSKVAARTPCALFDLRSPIPNQIFLKYLLTF